MDTRSHKNTRKNKQTHKQHHTVIQTHTVVSHNDSMSVPKESEPVLTTDTEFKLASEPEHHDSEVNSVEASDETLLPQVQVAGSTIPLESLTHISSKTQPDPITMNHESDPVVIETDAFTDNKQTQEPPVHIDIQPIVTVTSDPPISISPAESVEIDNNHDHIRDDMNGIDNAGSTYTHLPSSIYVDPSGSSETLHSNTEQNHMPAITRGEIRIDDKPDTDEANDDSDSHGLTIPIIGATLISGFLVLCYWALKR